GDRPPARPNDCAGQAPPPFFAAGGGAPGKTPADACYPRHRHQEFLRFLKKVATAHPGTKLHIVLDNYGTHKHPDVRRWLAKPENARSTLHFTPTGGSWPNMAEFIFVMITHQATPRGPIRTVKTL